MRILFLCHSFNSLSQRLFVELRARGHEVSVEFDINDEVAIEAVQLFAPDLIVAPFLKRSIPRAIWENHVCLIVHPGPVGDQGPAALDWAILRSESEWGITVLQADAVMDGGPVWAWRRFPMREAAKSSLYRQEVTDAATAAVLEAVEKFASKAFTPQPLSAFSHIEPRWSAGVRQADRAIDWDNDGTAAVLRKIASADGMPGVRDVLFGKPVFLYDAHPASGLPPAPPGTVIARSGPAIARATRDGAVWIGHVKAAREKTAVKLPATHLFADEAAHLPRCEGYRDIWYEETHGAGYLHFPFYNGAMGTEACRRLLDAYRDAIARPARLLVLMGGPEHWSNGLNINLIEAAESPADESWRNINAIDDISEAVIRTESKLVVAAIGGNAGAGGVFLARAADQVWLSASSVLNPHYKDMGNLYGSELWTYLLPLHAGAENARRVTQGRLPMGAAEALSLGLADHVLNVPRSEFLAEVKRRAAALAASPALSRLIEEKAARRARDEAEKPLSAYRAEELVRMRRNFYGFDPSYHVARYNFVHKIPKSRTPVTIAGHRDASRTPKPARMAAS